MSIIVPRPPEGLTGKLGVQRRLTKAFIDALPVALTLIPRTKVKLPAGGFSLVDGSPRAVQVVTLVEQTGLSGQPTPRTTVDGVERVVEFQLIAEWDAAIARFDVFSYQGKSWEIVDLFLDNRYEKRALVSSRG